MARTLDRSKKPTPKGKSLTTKQRLFVEAYLANPNATEAARKAGYAGNDVTLATVGAENLRKPQIASFLGKRVEAAAMSADEVLKKLTDQANASILDLIDDDGEFDLSKIRAAEKGGLIKKLKIRKVSTTNKDGEVAETTQYEFEIHDSQTALVHLGRYHKLFTDKLEHGGEVTQNLQGDITLKINQIYGGNDSQD